MQNDDIKNEVLQRLESDPQLQFKVKHGKYFSQGYCPACGKREAFVQKEEPWVVLCSRQKNCGERTSVRSLYEDIFTEFTERYPVREDDPNATAKAYLRYNRAFDPKRIEGQFEQAQLPIFAPNGNIKQRVETIRFPFLNGYWERLLDASAVRANGGKKAHIKPGLKYRGEGWEPNGQTYESGDLVYITEGIFKSIAFMHMETPGKTIAAISCSNLPSNIITANKGKGVVWVLAYDNDNAGIKAVKKFKNQLNELGEDFLIALPPVGKDWDDLHRTNQLTESLLSECFYRGRLLTSDTQEEKAFWQFCKRVLLTYRFDFEDSIYRASYDEKRADEEQLQQWREEYPRPWEIIDSELSGYQNAVNTALQIEKISNCVPSFRYIERDAIYGDQFYFFKVTFASGNEPTLVAMEGGALESKSSFSKALLNNTAGGLFDGSDKDLKHYRERWFSVKTNEVRALPFVGYDRQSKAYVYPHGAYHQGRFIPVNSDGYIDIGKAKIKTALRSFGLDHNQDFDPSWFKDFYTAFNANGLTALAWWLGTLFAEQIRGFQKSWPFMELTGDQGAGKSTIIEFMWRLMGRSNFEGFDPNKSTNAGRARSFVQVSNLPVILIEGDRNTDERNAKKGPFDLDELKTTYDGRPFRAMGVAKRGTDTEELPFRGGIMISQNATVDGSEALLARIVHCHCDRSHFTEAGQLSAQKLAKLDSKTLSGFLHFVLTKEEELLATYKANFERLLPKKTNEFPQIQNRLVLNHTQVLAWANCLPVVFGKQLDREIVEEIETHLFNRAQDRQNRLRSDHPMVAEFWDIYESENLNVGKYANAPLAVFNHSKNNDAIAISLVDFMAKCGNRNLGKELNFTLLKRLLPNSQRYKFDAQKTVDSQLEGKKKKCWVFINNQEKS